MPIKFDAVAYFSRAIGNRRRASTRDQGVASVFAETPQGAAHMWFWRLGVDERAVVSRVLVWPPKPHPMIETYLGPVIVYHREKGQLVEIERRMKGPPGGHH